MNFYEIHLKWCRRSVQIFPISEPSIHEPERRRSYLELLRISLDVIPPMIYWQIKGIEVLKVSHWPNTRRSSRAKNKTFTWVQTPLLTSKRNECHHYQVYQGHLIYKILPARTFAVKCPDIFPLTASVILHICAFPYTKYLIYTHAYIHTCVCIDEHMFHNGIIVFVWWK